MFFLGDPPPLLPPPPSLLPSVLASFCSFLSFQDLHINLFLSPFFYHSFFLSFFSLLLSPSLLLSFPSYLTLAVPPTFPSFMPFHLSTSLCPPPPLGHLFCSSMCTTLPRSPPSPSLFPSYPTLFPTSLSLMFYLCPSLNIPSVAIHLDLAFPPTFLLPPCLPSSFILPSLFLLQPLPLILLSPSLLTLPPYFYSSVLLPAFTSFTTNCVFPYLLPSLSSSSSPLLSCSLLLCSFLPFLASFHSPLTGLSLSFASIRPTSSLFPPSKLPSPPASIPPPSPLLILIACRKLPDIVRCNVLSDSSLSVLK